MTGLLSRPLACLTAALLLCTAVCAGAGPKPPAKTVAVELGKDFRLRKGETARLPGGRATLSIARFINSPCPKGAVCAWSGQDVVYELKLDGKASAANAPDAPYDVVVKESDFTTFAVFAVDEPERACGRADAGQRGECWRSLALRRRSASLCRSIDDGRTRGLCFEDVAEELSAPALCGEVASPSQYCLYVRAKAAGEPAACDGIVLFRWRVRCFKELTREGGGGPKSCADLEPGLAKACREYVAGPDR